MNNDRIILNYKPDSYNAVDIYKYDIPKNLKYVYSYLERHIKIEGNRCPIKEEIAYYTDISKRTVDEIIKELEKVGLVEVIPQIDSTGQKGNLYLLNHPDQVGIKELPPFAEVHARKLMEKKNAKNAPRKNQAMQNMHPGDAKSAPRENQGVQNLQGRDAENALLNTENEQTQENQGISVGALQNLHPSTSTSSNSLVDSLVSNMLNDESISDEEIIQVVYQKYVGEAISFDQAEKMVQVAVEQNMSLEEIIEEIKYTAVKAKTNPSGHLYRSLSTGGYYKKKLEKEAEKAKQEQEKPKHRLVRQKKEEKQLPKALRMDQKQPEQPANQENLEEKQRLIREKLRLMNERFNARKENQPTP